MKKLVIMGVILVLAAGQAQGLSGPANGGYVWMVTLNRVSNEFYEPILKVFQFDQNYLGVTGSFVTFSPMVPNNYIAAGQYAYGPGERCGLPSIYESSTPAGYGKLLMGVYADNSPAGARATTQTMDILCLSPQAGGALNYTNVYGGKADVSGQFHTEDATQALYDKTGLFTGTPESVLVTGETGNMNSRTDGYCTDVDGDGYFNGASDTETYVNLSTIPGKKVTYQNRIFAQTQWLGTYGGTNYGGADGIYQCVYSGGSYTQTLYFVDKEYAAGGSVLDFSWGGDLGGPGLAIGDTNGNGVPEVYISLYNHYFDHDDNALTPDVYAYGIGRLEDLDGDGDALDPSEQSVFFITGRMNGPVSPMLPGTIWQTNGGPRSIAVIQGTDGSWSLLCSMPGHWQWGTTYFALGIADNGEFNGEAAIIASNTGLASDTWPHFGSTFGGSYDLYDEIIPEPGTILLLGTGLIGALGYLRRRRTG